MVTNNVDMLECNTVLYYQDALLPLIPQYRVNCPEISCFYLFRIAHAKVKAGTDEELCCVTSFYCQNKSFLNTVMYLQK